MGYWETLAGQRVARRRLLRAGGAFSIGAAGLALLGCGSDGGDEPEPDAGGQTTGAVGEPRVGGRYGSWFGAVKNWSVLENDHDSTRIAGITVYDRPITTRLDKRGYVLEAAAKIELPEPTRVVITLKPNLVYHDKAPVNGRKVLASDIVSTQNFVKTLTAADNSAFQRNFLDRVEAPNDTTVIYHLKKPSAYLFSSVVLGNASAQAIIPKEMLEQLQGTPPIGSGPYYHADSTFNSRYLFKRFDRFRGADKAGPYFAEREIIALSDAVAQEAAFRAEQIHEWTPANSAVNRLIKELDGNKFKNISYLASGLSGFNANMNAALGGPRPWHDVRVREAIYRVTNREQFINLVLDQKAVVTSGPIHASLEAYQLASADTQKFFANDVNSAKQLLSAANYDSSKEWEINCSNTSAQNAQMAEVWQQQLSQIGIKIRVVALPLSVLNPERISTAKFDLFMGGQPGGDSPSRAIRNQASDTTDQFNNVGLYDKAIDALVEKSETTIDREENIKLVKQIQMDALKLYSMSYITHTAQAFSFYNSRLQNLEIDPIAGQQYQLQAWLSD